MKLEQMKLEQMKLEQTKQEQPNQGINHHTDHLWSFNGNVCRCLLPHVYVKPYLRHYVMKSCHCLLPHVYVKPYLRHYVMKSCHCLLPHVYVKPYLRHYVMKSCHISFFIQDSTLLHAFKTASLTHKVNYATLKLYYCPVNNNNTFSVSITLCTLGQNILVTEYSWDIKPHSLVINSWKHWRKLV